MKFFFFFSVSLFLLPRTYYKKLFCFVICLPVKQNSVFLLFIYLTNRIERNGRRETSCLCPSLWKVGGGGKKNNIDLKSMEINNNSSKLSHSYFISTKSFTGINVSDNSISYHGVSVWMAISKFFFFWFSHFIYALSAISPDTDIGLYELTTVTMGRLKRFRMWYPKEKDPQIKNNTNLSNMIKYSIWYYITALPPPPPPYLTIFQIEYLLYNTLYYILSYILQWPG